MILLIIMVTIMEIKTIIVHVTSVFAMFSLFFLLIDAWCFIIQNISNDTWLVLNNLEYACCFHLFHILAHVDFCCTMFLSKVWWLAWKDKVDLHHVQIHYLLHLKLYRWVNREWFVELNHHSHHYLHHCTQKEVFYGPLLV